jgi:hypothetical protein
MKTLPLLLFSIWLAVADEAPWSIKTQESPPPADLAEPVRALIGEQCIELLDASGEAAAEFWFRKEIPAKATDAQIKNGLTYREVAETTVLGALKVNKEFHDYRRQTLAPGVYTLRLAFQPPTDDHTGSAPYTEFLLACPADEDKKPDLVEPKSLQELSKRCTGKHPAVLLLVPGKNAQAEPKLVKKGEGHWTIMAGIAAAAGDAKATLALGLTVAGSSPKAKP